VTFSVGLGSLLRTLNHPDPQTQSLLFCKVRGYLFQLSIILPRWFVAFACIDRYASTSVKVHLRNFAQPRMAHRIIVLITMIWSLICTHRLIFFEIKEDLCGITNNTGASLFHTSYVVFAVGIFPSVAMIICTYLIRHNLSLRQRRRAQLSPVLVQRNSLDQQVLRMLVVQIICYILFTLPQMGNLVFNTISTTIPNRSKTHLAIERLVQFAAELMLYLFGVTTFYLYTLTSPTFRSEFITSIQSLVARCSAHRVAPRNGIPLHNL
jgi:hypothetical protein